MSAQTFSSFVSWSNDGGMTVPTDPDNHRNTIDGL